MLTFHTFESTSSSPPTKRRNSKSAVAVPRKGSSFGPPMRGRGRGGGRGGRRGGVGREVRRWVRRSVGRVLRVGGCTCSLLLLTAPVVSSFHRKYSWLTTGVMRLLTQRRSKSSGAGKIDFLLELMGGMACSSLHQGQSGLQRNVKSKEVLRCLSTPCSCPLTCSNIQVFTSRGA